MCVRVCLCVLGGESLTSGKWWELTSTRMTSSSPPPPLHSASPLFRSLHSHPQLFHDFPELRDFSLSKAASRRQSACLESLPLMENKNCWSAERRKKRWFYSKPVGRPSSNLLKRDMSGKIQVDCKTIYIYTHHSFLTSHCVSVHHHHTLMTESDRKGASSFESDRLLPFKKYSLWPYFHTCLGVGLWILKYCIS